MKVVWNGGSVGGGVAVGGKTPMMPLGHQLGAGAVAQAASRTLMIVWGVFTWSPPKFQISGGSVGKTGPLGGNETVGLVVGSTTGLGDGEGAPGDGDGAPGDGEGASAVGEGDGDGVTPGSRLGGGPTGVGDGYAAGGRTGYVVGV